MVASWCGMPKKAANAPNLANQHVGIEKQYWALGDMIQVESSHYTIQEAY